MTKEDASVHFRNLNPLKSSGIEGIPINISCGLSKGSILGPLLFIIYINDLTQAIEFQVRLFANDTKLTLSHSRADNLQASVNEELPVNKIDCWMKINKLSVNYKKTEYSYSGNKEKT